MKKLFIILFVLLANTVYAGDITIKNGNVYQDYYSEGNIRPEIDKLQFYLFKSMFNYKYIFEVEDLHNYIMSVSNPKIKFYRGGHTVSLDTTLYNNLDWLFVYNTEWYVSYVSGTCSSFDIKKGKVKKCQQIGYIIDKPADENKAYFRIEIIDIKNENKKISVTNRQVILNEEFTQYGN